MHTLPPFDADLLRRYDRPGPRYTSYPTAPNFSEKFDARAYREVARASNADPIPRALSLYVHVPFCLSPCFYCGCNRIITRDLGRGETYLGQLQHEIGLVAPLFDRDREVVQLHLGGGTPNFLTPELLEALIASLGREFQFSTRSDRDFSIELDPRSVNPDGIARLAALGFNRASLGVQDFDPDVQAAVNRIQSVEETLAVIDACRRYGFRSINVDLIYGLPRQNLAGFARTLDSVIAVRPDRLAVYSYAHLPDLFKAQKQIKHEDLLAPDMKLRLLELAIEKLSAAGYRYIGMDHFALPEDELSLAQEKGSLQRNFMGYTTHAETDLIGLGVSAISHIGNSYSQNARDLNSYVTAVESGRLPVIKGLQLDADDELRADLINHLMCQGEIDKRGLEARFDIDFDQYFAHSIDLLPPLIADGLVIVDKDFIRVTLRGRLLLRVVAMCFDRYLQRVAEPARFSKAI
ncbi:oxygen-independent coproporphyrinogen III oxidase [Aquimonas sp.]|jgi:oxygen-independent coproporphyrinogen-3 oxidase|uniref:oxygen-independent coproporphyrinogen III oxidase n=1 Tax=Aquimonas sp. TaxID=1872588 RepID=UPI0037C01555